MAQRIVIWRAMAAVAIAVALLSAAPGTQAAASKGNHCIAEAGKTPATNGEALCFDTFAKALSAATQGQAQVAGTLTPEALTQAMLPQAVGQDVLAVVYWDINYGGKSLILYSSNGRCTGSNVFSYPSMPSGWDNKLSSIRVYGGCTTATLYEHINFVGRVKWVYSQTPWVGQSFNDQTSSIRMY